MKTIIALSLLLTFSFSTDAGRMKDLFIDHQDAVLEHLGEQSYIDTWSFTNTRFVKASPGADLAIESTVSTYVHELNKKTSLTCTTEFYRVNEDRYDISFVGCQ